MFCHGSWWFVMVRGGSWWFIMVHVSSWFVVVHHGSWWFVVVRHGSSWFMFCHGSWSSSWFMVVCHGSCFVMVHGGSSWFNTYLTILKKGVVSLMSQLQLVSWFIMVRHGLILLCHLVLNFIKTNAASSDNF